MGACVSSDILGPKPLDNESSFVIGEKPVSKVICPLSESDVDICQLSSANFQSFGIKDDVFLDAERWLESDAEDDFFSANGDLTPSGTPYSSSTPIHRNFLVAHSDSPENIQVRYRHVQTPALWRKSLSELFLESDNERQKDISNNLSKTKMDEDMDEIMSTALASKSANSTSSISELKSSCYDSERSPTKNSKKHRSSKSAQCLPSIFLMYSPKSPHKKTSVK